MAVTRREYFGKTDLLYLLNLLHTELAKYVPAEDGKGLSANDLTDELLEEINKVGEKADLASPEFTGIPVAPTAATGTDTTQIATTAFVNAAISFALNDVTGIKFEKVEALPAKGAAGVIYLLQKTTSGTNNVYTEYYWDGAAFEILGDTSMDLSKYIKDTDLVEIETSEVQASWNSVFTTT